MLSVTVFHDAVAGKVGLSLEVVKKSIDIR